MSRKWSEARFSGWCVARCSNNQRVPKDRAMRIDWNRVLHHFCTSLLWLDKIVRGKSKSNSNRSLIDWSSSGRTAALLSMHSDGMSAHSAQVQYLHPHTHTLSIEHLVCVAVLLNAQTAIITIGPSCAGGLLGRSKISIMLCAQTNYRALNRISCTNYTALPPAIRWRKCRLSCHFGWIL